MQIAIPVFDGITALDAIGPYEVLQRLPDATVVFVGAEVGSVRSDNGFLGICVDAPLSAVDRPDVVVVPGGTGTRPLLGGHPILDWVRDTYAHTRFTTSVCTGSLVLAAAGLLDGLTAATHWGAYDTLAGLGAEPVPDRVVEHVDRRILTAAGVSSGIDMALRLSELLVDADAARAMQLMIEYDPQPPFDAGSVDKAGEAVMARARRYAETKR